MGVIRAYKDEGFGLARWVSFEMSQYPNAKLCRISQGWGFVECDGQDGLACSRPGRVDLAESI